MTKQGQTGRMDLWGVISRAIGRNDVARFVQLIDLYMEQTQQPSFRLSRYEFEKEGFRNEEVKANG